MLKRLILASAVAFSVPVCLHAETPTPTAADATVDPARLALAKQFLNVAMPPDKRAAMFGSMMNAITAQARASMSVEKFSGDKDFQQVLDRSVDRMFHEINSEIQASLPAMFDAMAHAYARKLSADDLNQMIVFAKTPAGQHYFDTIGSIMQDPDIKAATAKMNKEMMAKYPEMLNQMTADISDYMAKKESEAKAKGKTTTS